MHALRGELDAARRELDGSPEDGLPSEIVVPLAAARATLALAAGEPAAARVHLAGALAAVPDPFYTPPAYSLAVRAEAELAEEARAHRRPVDARRATALLADLDALLDGATTPDARAHRALAFAELARVTGEPATERWRAAAATWDGLAAPYPAAYARLQAAEALLRENGERPAATAAPRRGPRNRRGARRAPAPGRDRGAGPARPARPRAVLRTHSRGRTGRADRARGRGAAACWPRG